MLELTNTITRLTDLLLHRKQMAKDYPIDHAHYNNNYELELLITRYQDMLEALQNLNDQASNFN